MTIKKNLTLALVITVVTLFMGSCDLTFDFGHFDQELEMELIRKTVDEQLPGLDALTEAEKVGVVRNHVHSIGEFVDGGIAKNPYRFDYYYSLLHSVVGGLSDDRAFTMVAILLSIGVEARVVLLQPPPSEKRAGLVVVEAFVDGSWEFHDPMYNRIALVAGDRVSCDTVQQLRAEGNGGDVTFSAEGFTERIVYDDVVEGGTYLSYFDYVDIAVFDEIW